MRRPMVDDDDEALCRELLRAFRDGDRSGAWAAVDRLSRKGGLLQRTVAAVARGFGADEARTKDVAQEVALKLLRWEPQTTRKSARGQMKSWIRVVAKRKLIDELRKKKKELLDDERERTRATQTAPSHDDRRVEESPDREQQDMDRQACMERMRVADQLLVRFGDADMTALEIAHAAGLIDAATLANFASRQRPPHGQADERVRLERRVDKRKQRARDRLRDCVERKRMAREYRAALLRQADAGRAR